MDDFRCRNCGNLLAKEEIGYGKLEIKCPKCNTFNVVERMVFDSRRRDGYSGDK